MKTGGIWVVLGTLALVPILGFVSCELLQRHRHSTLVGQWDDSLRSMEADVQMECVDPKNLLIAVGASNDPIRLKREVRKYDIPPHRASVWNLTATCDRHAPNHGLRMEFQVTRTAGTSCAVPT